MPSSCHSRLLPVSETNLPANSSFCVQIEKSDAKDFKFFMDQPNFLKVVDSLEKFQQAVVNVQSEEGKEFILFKRQLYQMYEV